MIQGKVPNEFDSRTGLRKSQEKFSIVVILKGKFNLTRERRESEAGEALQKEGET
jgi:hypothetical protein